MKTKFAARVEDDNETLVYATTKQELANKSLALARKHKGKQIDKFEWKGGGWADCGSEVVFDPCTAATS